MSIQQSADVANLRGEDAPAGRTPPAPADPLRDAPLRGAPPRGAPPWASGWRGLGASMLVSAVVPLIAYRLARPETGSDALALVIAGAIPVTWTLVRLVWRKRLDPVGVFCVAAFGLGLVILVLAGGSALAFKIREPVLAGSFGLLCLASLAVRRPLALIALRRAGHKASDQALRGAASGITAIAGVTLTVHAAVLIGLAVTVSSGTYLALSQPIGLPILGAGVAALLWRKRRSRSAAPAGRGDPAGPS